MAVSPEEQELSDAWDERFRRARDEGISVEDATYIADRYVEQCLDAGNRLARQKGR